MAALITLQRLPITDKAGHTDELMALLVLMTPDLSDHTDRH